MMFWVPACIKSFVLTPPIPIHDESAEMVPAIPVGRVAVHDPETVVKLAFAIR